DFWLPLCSTPSCFVKTKPPFRLEKAGGVQNCTRTARLFVRKAAYFASSSLAGGYYTWFLVRSFEAPPPV
ncbi:MAG: hypothetical protein ACLUH4_08710, partial [Alphaproteobacteria bacterium]